MTTQAEFDGERVEVAPGGEATAIFTVRNNTDIVEAYEFEVVGECADWTAVIPERLPVYPGEQGTVTLVLRPPQSSEVPAGEVPLAVRVVPVEQPDLVAVPETTVVIAPFHRFRGALTPQRRRAWRSGRFVVSVHDQGNTPIAVPLAATDPAEELAFSFDSERLALNPGDRTEVRLRVRAGGLIWFGKPASKPFHVTASGSTEEAEAEELDGELVQLPLLPRWLLALLGLLLALLLLWYALVLPELTSAAQEAARRQTEQMVADGELAPPQPPAEEPPPGEPGGGEPPPPANPAATGQQHSATIEVNTRPGGAGARSYAVPEGQDFYVTDLVLANYQGDEGLLTIEFDGRTITTIALETFRNQDYHWVTPIKVPSEAAIEATVRCARPGTPPYGPTEARCVQQLNVSGTVAPAPR
ncbi:hydrolytic protein [Saccharopolyspora sp. TS4A08]|uniref:Hydrolytic protein n=1 Tax=Saccharopolyspora ipomoeae TaxID=3042027 RepID=A0ABT6PVJ0_9PSEU|nr:hydrolytic protein [Saccharopolyspora sp. TS4A08]MDI2031971.1 hydrolytic protein [Saccharopolyspora sp. TS4A08]